MTDAEKLAVAFMVDLDSPGRQLTRDGLLTPTAQRVVELVTIVRNNALAQAASIARGQGELASSARACTADAILALKW